MNQEFVVVEIEVVIALKKKNKMTEEQEKVYYLISQLPDRLDNLNAVINNKNEETYWLVGNIRVLKEIIKEWKEKCIE